MFRVKGWVPNYKSMNFEQIRREIRHLQMIDRPVLDKEEKLNFLAREITLKNMTVLPSNIRDKLLKCKPGGIVHVKGPLFP